MIKLLTGFAAACYRSNANDHALQQQGKQLRRKYDLVLC